MAPGKHRLVTRSDFDGVVCGMLLRELEIVEEVRFVHPKDMQDGLVIVTPRDIVTNLPYVEGCHLVFDHRASEMKRRGKRAFINHIVDPNAASAARVVYNHYGGAAAFPRISESLIAAVDKADSAQFTRDEILDPQGWILLNFLMDARTGLGRFRNFRISNYEFMMQFIEHCRNLSMEEILALPDVRERIELYHAQRASFAHQLARCSTMHDKLVVIDLRDEVVIYAGNRFVVYALFPKSNMSMHIMWGRQRQNTVFAIGISIFNRGAQVKIGAVCQVYGGGGHDAAGTFQVANDWAEAVKAKVILSLSND